MRVPHQTMLSAFSRILESSGLHDVRAVRCATLFAAASLDGVSSHGLNRFPGFAKSLSEDRFEDLNSDPVLLHAAGCVERWDGQLGIGLLNAEFCMKRAMAISKEHGMGCVALQRTNHWMRPGNYGYLAVSEGFAAMCWTNTTTNMPGWGSSQKIIGNNPLVIACPNPSGEPVVLDMAMSQYSFGRMHDAHRQGEMLEVVAGYDKDGKPTNDPGEIINGGVAQPAGLWKGAGLAVMLDILAAVLSGGDASWQIAQSAATHGERGVSQVYVAWDLSALGEHASSPVSGIIKSLEDSNTSYPGKRALAFREDALQNGIPVDEERWKEVEEMLAAVGA